MLICVGLAVDYAAHIAHMFKDTRSQRLPGVSLIELLNSGEVFENSIQHERLSDAALLAETLMLVGANEARGFSRQNLQIQEPFACSLRSPPALRGSVPLHPWSALGPALSTRWSPPSWQHPGDCWL